MTTNVPVGSMRPNIVFIMADDHASKAISCYGAGLNKTPNLDRIANGGMRFDHCYVTNSICTPSRAAILTGTHNHVNGVMTLHSKLSRHTPNVAKQLRSTGYQTAMIGKWHLGEGKLHEPSGFDVWSVLPGQGEYHDPEFIEPSGTRVIEGYTTDIITDMTLEFIEKRDQTKPFFVMCHHKAPHRSWEYQEKYKHLFQDRIQLPDTFSDDYKNRARAAAVAKMRVAEDLSYKDLGLAQPDGDRRRAGEKMAGGQRKVPTPPTDAEARVMRLIDNDDGTVFRFQTKDEVAEFKFQRYMQRYLRTVQSIDDNVGRILDLVDSEPQLAENTIVVYTSDQGFFLGEHGWFDKRFIYEESSQMPLMVRFPKEVKAGSVCSDIVCNVDFAPTFLDLAGAITPSYMQGRSFRSILHGDCPSDWDQLAYHRYWMHNDAEHEAYAHYGVRNHRYKLIYWYNDDFLVEGARPGGEDCREWELFDCHEDPLELFNCYSDGKYKEVVGEMRRLLERKMAEIGDEVAHEAVSIQ